MKNTGGRHGGSITAAQFLQRFSSTTRHGRISISRERRWARRKPRSIRGWGSGFGVRLLERLVADHYEK